MQTPFKQGTIVLASRDEELAEMVGQALAALGKQAPRLSMVHNLPDALVATRLLSPSLMLLDDGIEGGPGVELLDQVLEASPGMPVVYLASQHSLDLERTIRRRGVLFYIAKPEEKEVLQSTFCSVFQCLARSFR